jgi:hypothetical protein
MQVATKYKMEAKSLKLVNYSSSNLRSAWNISDALKNKVINPWSISSDNVQLIEEDDVVYDYDGLKNYNSANLVGVLAISVVFGSILSILGEEGKPVVELVGCIFKVMMKMVDLFIWYVYLFIHFNHRQSRRQGLETQAKAPMMLHAIRDMALSTSMHGVAAQPWSFFRKKYDANPALFLFILWIEGHLNIVFLVYN